MLTAGCNPPGKPNPANRPETPSQIVSFEQLFTQNCSGCHGADGNLGPAPPLNDPIFLSIITKDEILDIIHNGRHGTPMPAFARAAGGSLTSAQINIVADEILKHWKPARPPEETLPPYLLAGGGDDQATQGDRQQGAKLFAQACAECHGTDGTGEGGDAGAINDPDFLALISNQALRRIIITGRPDLGMPSYDGSDGRPEDFKPLTSDEINDLVALLVAWRAGTKVARVPQRRSEPVR